MLEKLMDSPIAWLVLSMFTVLGIILSIYFGVKSKKILRLSFSKKSYRLVKKGKKAVAKLQILFEDKEIENVTITKIAFWNSGNTVINKNDIVSDRQLSIIAKNGAKLLEAQVIANVDSSNKISIANIQDSHAIVDFEYVDKHEGAVIQIIHTGEADDIDLDYKIKGGRPIKDESTGGIINFMKSRSIKKAISVSLGVYFLFFSFYLIGLILAVLNIIPKEKLFEPPKNPQVYLMVLTISMLIASTALFYLFIKSAKTTFKLGIPNKLKGHMDFLE